MERCIRPRKKIYPGIVSAAMLAGLFISGCIPHFSPALSPVPTVPDLDLRRYAGTWYEIARLPHGFEKNMEQVTATYTINADGTIRVVNKGFDLRKKRWKQATATAWRPAPDRPGHLRVRFFWPFTADYNVIAMDSRNYQWAMVTSRSKKYLWILSRKPSMDETRYIDLVDRARQWGFDVGALHRVSH